MRHLIIGLLFVVSTAAFGQDIRRDASGARRLRMSAGGCIGGLMCRERTLRVPLEDRPVIAIRFHAHDQIGEKAGGVLRIKIDGDVVRDDIDIPRAGETFTFEVDELQGRYLVFEAAVDDEIEISGISVKYGSVRRERRHDDLNPRGGGWRAYPGVGGCIGGDECRRNGTRITIALEDAPVLGIRFHAHDAIGQRAEGRLKVRIDGEDIDPYLDVQRAGRLHDFEVDNLHGSRLVIETATDDEVHIKDIEVLYKRDGRNDEDFRDDSRGDSREVTDEGKCIGGSQCGGNGTRIRIPIYSRPVNNIRFFARNRSGARAGAELSIRIDENVLESAVDVDQGGPTYIIDGKSIQGSYLIIEPAGDSEVEVKHIRVRFEDD